jgi:curved DNA-binding protein CbpA
MTDFYEVLGVSKSATAVEIRQAYVKLARERHPDRFPDPVEKEKAHTFFRDLTTAFNTLFNEGSRRLYDSERERKKPTNPQELAQDAYDRAQALGEQGGSPDEILTLLRAAVHHRPNEARYHAALGRFQGRHSTLAREAVQSLERAIQLSPQTAAFHADLALILHKQKLKIRAQKAVEQALRLAPRDPHVQKVAALVNEA